MMSGDGLVVRVRPMLVRLTTEQALGLCDLAEQYGSGVIDLTNRANLQLRGVQPDHHDALLEGLHALDLLPDDPELEARRNILVPVDWHQGDDTSTLARELISRLHELPPLPAKFGFAIDAGHAPILQDGSADLRIERSAHGLILRLDGAPRGIPVTTNTAIDHLIEMAHWFVSSGGFEVKRMARHLKTCAAPEGVEQIAPHPARAKLAIGAHELGAVYGVAFGQMLAPDLRSLLTTSAGRALRVTPWRRILIEGAAPQPSDVFITRDDDPLKRVDACSGIKGCPSGEIDTRTLARELAEHAKGSLHVSGCAKGCARPRAADLTLVGRAGKIDLVRNGKPWDDPSLTALTPNDLKDRIGEF